MTELPGIADRGKPQPRAPGFPSRENVAKGLTWAFRLVGWILDRIDQRVRLEAAEYLCAAALAYAEGSWFRDVRYRLERGEQWRQVLRRGAVGDVQGRGLGAVRWNLRSRGILRDRYYREHAEEGA